MDARIENGKPIGCRSTLEKILIVVAVVLFMLVIIFIILFATSVHEDSNSDIKECTTRDCVMASSKLAAKMDFKADPCENFAQYACGGFYKNTLIPDDRNAVTSFSIVYDAMIQEIRLLMEEDLHVDDPGYARKLKTYYKSCMNLDEIDKIGLSPYYSTRMQMEWPTISGVWDASTFDLNAMAEKFGRVYSYPLFQIAVDVDFSDSTKYMLHVAQPQLEITRTTTINDRQMAMILGAHEDNYKRIAIALGAHQIAAATDAKKLYSFKHALALISDTQEDMMDVTKLINPSTLGQMNEAYPYMDFYRNIAAIFETANITLSMDQPINILNPMYFEKLGNLIETTEKRVIQNLYGFDFSYIRISTFSKKMRDIKKELTKALNGKSMDTPRWKECLNHVKDYFGSAVAKMFISKAFPKDSKTWINGMIDNLDSSFEEMLKETKWLQPKTKETAFKKLHHMKRQIGYPDENFDDKDIEEEYKHITVNEGQFYLTSVDIIYHTYKTALQYVNQPFENVWRLNPVDVNAAYSYISNEIVFPAGIMQPPFYSPQNPSSVNFGAMGFLIGHEITHGFDQSGSHFDHEGNLNAFWERNDVMEFRNMSQCVIDKYGAFKVEEIDMNINGKLTVKENTADLGGLKEAFRAYKKYAASHPEELPLPGLGLTTDKQFFLAFAQLFCTKKTKAKQLKDLMNSVHAPSKYRIIGTLQNTQDFADVFQCPSGSFMNPAEKCVVW